MSPTAALGIMGKRIVLVDRQTRAQHPLNIPAPAKICGFSKDGSQLLLIALRVEAGKEKGDAHFLNLKNGGRRLIAKAVTEAVWVEVPRQALVRRPEGRRRGRDPRCWLGRSEARTP
jgi:hypothetical protein